MNIAEMLEEVTYVGAEVVYDASAKDDYSSFFLLISGECELRGKMIGRGSIFGRMGAFVSDAHGTQIPIATGSDNIQVISVVGSEDDEPLRCLTLSNAAYARLLGRHFTPRLGEGRMRSMSSMEEVHQKRSAEGRRMSKIKSMRLTSRRSSLSELPVKEKPKLAEFHQRGILGSGSFASVYIVESRQNTSNAGSSFQETYAMKVLRKEDIFEMRQVVPVMREKAVLNELSEAAKPNPFIVRLHATFQDTHNLYFLLELVQGGELWSLIHSSSSPLLSDLPAQLGGIMRGMRESACRFYAANVVSALIYMHSRGVAYRDLKPENLLVNKKGYLKFVDFGFAKHIPFQIDDVYHEKSYTLCGSPEYLAPELLLATGHGKGVDWWALGAMIAEMMFGITPFAPSKSGSIERDALNPNQQQIYANITKNIWEPTLRPAFEKTSPEALDLVLKLLEPKDELRIKYERVKDHPWFGMIDRDGLEEPVDWHGLEMLHVEPPHIPSIAGPLDRSQFIRTDDDGEDSDDEEASRGSVFGDAADEVFCDYYDGKFLGF